MQNLAIEFHMIFHECRYEVITVVVAGLTAQQQRDFCLRAGALQQLGAKLLGQKLIGVADIDQQIGKPCAVLDERNSVVSAPGRTIIAGRIVKRLSAQFFTMIA